MHCPSNENIRSFEKDRGFFAYTGIKGRGFPLVSLDILCSLHRSFQRKACQKNIQVADEQLEGTNTSS